MRTCVLAVFLAFVPGHRNITVVTVALDKPTRWSNFETVQRTWQAGFLEYVSYGIGINGPSTLRFVKLLRLLSERNYADMLVGVI